MIRKKLLTVLAVSVGTLVFAPAVRADLHGFVNITGNDAGNAAIGEAQLFVDVTPVGSDQALFAFLNTGPEASSITDVYFDSRQGALLNIANIDDSEPGMEFSQNASPGNLPGANSITPAFAVTAGLSADSDPPAQPNGVNPGESLGILFDISDGMFGNVTTGLADGSLRVGIHVQGFANGGSESFVNDGVIPAPSAALLGLIGLGLVGWMKQRGSTPAG